ncbi:MAG: outer membrane beta-barrel protein [Bacteroidaceae bacterium]|nr:outer membrane beta-barrel protein [Bacteroidaceae bacterium]
MKKHFFRCGNLRILLLLCLIVGTETIVQADILRGRVVDAETKEPLPGATLKLTQRKDYNGHMATWVMSQTADTLGCFTLNLQGRGTLETSMLGYYSKTEVVLGFSDDKRDTINVGNIELKPSETLMKMLEVKGRARRFTVRGDTIVFHPEAFHLQEGARLDELIKQLPGVQVADDGSMTWNGKPIRITMDGESLFGGNGLVSQLPVEAVENIKAYNKASKFSERTGKDDGQEDMVLDLTVKPGFLDRWYGDASAGYQSPKHYDADLDMHRFSKINPAILLLNANNVNRQKHRTMNGGWIRQGNGHGQGQSATGGYQHNWRQKEGTQEMRSRYSFSGGLSHFDNWSMTRSETEDYLENADDKRTNTKTYQRNHALNPYLNANLSWDLDSLNTLIFEANADYTDMRNHGRTDMEQVGMLRRLTHNQGTGHEFKFDTKGTWHHFMGKDASLGASYNIRFADREDEQWTDREVEDLRSVAGDLPTGTTLSSLLSQHTLTPSTSFSATAEGHYKQWLLKRWLLGAEYSFDYKRNHSRQDFDTNGFADVANTYRDHNNLWRHGLSLNSTIDLSPIKLMPRLSTKWQHEHQDYQRGLLDTTATRQRLLLTPSLRVTWKMAKTIGIELNYDYSTTQPSLFSTLAYRDQTDPLYIREGNPGLKDTHTNNVRLNFNTVLARQQLSLSTTVAYRTSDRETRTALIYQPSTGVYTSHPENVRGSRSWSFRLNYDQGFGDIFRLQNDFRLTSEQNYAFLTQIITVPLPLPLGEGWEGVATLNRQQQFRTTDRLTISADWNWLKLSLYGELNPNRLHYSALPDQNTTVWSNNIGLRGELTKGKFVFTTAITECMYSGYTIESMNRNLLVWDASVTWKILKNKARLRLELDDILNAEDNKRISQSASQQTVTRYDYRHHFVALSLSYYLDAKEGRGRL